MSAKWDSLARDLLVDGLFLILCHASEQTVNSSTTKKVVAMCCLPTANVSVQGVMVGSPTESCPIYHGVEAPCCISHHGRLEQSPSTWTNGLCSIAPNTSSRETACAPQPQGPSQGSFNDGPAPGLVPLASASARPVLASVAGPVVIIVLTDQQGPTNKPPQVKDWC